MKIRVEFYGVLRQIMGTEQMSLDFAGATVADALEQLKRQQPALIPHLPRIACAIGSEIVTPHRALAGNEALALVPPVSGGAW